MSEQQALSDTRKIFFDSPSTDVEAQNAQAQAMLNLSRHYMSSGHYISEYNAKQTENIIRTNNNGIEDVDFVLDGDTNKVIFRDTLQLENLDLNELESTFNSLALLLSEYTDEIIEFSKK